MLSSGDGGGGSGGLLISLFQTDAKEWDSQITLCYCSDLSLTGEYNFHSALLFTHSALHAV